MNKTEVLNKLQEIFEDVFIDEDIVISEDTKASDVSSWDSLNHLYLMNTIEETFNFSFSLEEMTDSDSICKLVDIILKHEDKYNRSGM